jgi:tetratricopeptide (TPR) repeat protein
VDYLGADDERDLAAEENPLRKNGIFVRSGSLRIPFFFNENLIEKPPTARFGNLFLYRGGVDLPGQAAASLYYYGIRKIYTEKPDEAAAEKAWRRAAELSPETFFINIELGNLALRRGDRSEALDFYQRALERAPSVPAVRAPIEEQIALFSRASATGAISPLRNPNLE